MDYKSTRGVNFTIEELDRKGQQVFDFEARYIAMQDLTEEEKNNPNFLREVYTADTIEELKATIERAESFIN